MGTSRGAMLVVVASLWAAQAWGGVLETWTEVSMAAATAAPDLPPRQARTLAMVHVAMFEAVNGPDGPYTSYVFAAPPGRPRAPARRAAGPSADEAKSIAAVAAHGVLRGLYPKQVPTFDAALEPVLAGLPGPVRARAVAEGGRIAAAVLKLREADGSDAPNAVRPTTSAGRYVPTALPVLPEWGKVKPWVMKNGADLRPGPPPALDGALWARDYAEVQSIGATTSRTRTDAQTEAARFWVVTGPRSWLPIVAALTSAAARPLVDDARLYALVSMAGADSYISTFDTKYAYWFWRPITAIRNGDADGNPATERDAAWEPLIETPPHPEYICAHCISSATVGAVLESEFGAGPRARFTMTSPALPGVTRGWERIADYVDEVASARIWGGIHYRNSAEVGTTAGRKLGALAVGTVLRKR